MVKDSTIPVFTHILGLFTGFIGPLIVLLATKDLYAEKHAKKALNWHFSLIIYYILSFILTLVLIGFTLIIVLAIINAVFSIIAAVKASNNEIWDYPLSIKFFKS